MPTEKNGIDANETTVPLLSCVEAEAAVEFWRALGFVTTWEQYKPYLYLALRFSGFELHYGEASPSVDPLQENTGGALIMVDDVAAHHAEFVAAMRRTYGKVLAKGLPRITRHRPGVTRFTIMDPNGNSLIVIQRDEPQIEYGGSSQLSGLAKAIDNARVLREFKNDDLAASRALTSGLRRHAEGAPQVEIGIASAQLVELTTVLGKDPTEHLARLAALDLTPEERTTVRGSVANPDLLEL